MTIDEPRPSAGVRSATQAKTPRWMLVARGLVARGLVALGPVTRGRVARGPLTPALLAPMLLALLLASCAPPDTSGGRPELTLQIDDQSDAASEADPDAPPTGTDRPADGGASDGGVRPTASNLPEDAESSAPDDDPDTTAPASPTDELAPADSVLVEPDVLDPLTGLGAADQQSQPRRVRALVAKVGNHDRRSFPQAGLASADIVFEELIEGHSTRLVAVFHSEIPVRVGPIRSARTSDIDLLWDLGEPLFVYSGANDPVLSEVTAASRAGTLRDWGALSRYVNYERDPERQIPFNLYFRYDPTEPNSFRLGQEDPGVNVAPLFEYLSVVEAVAAVDDAPTAPTGVTVAYPSPYGTVASHIWDHRIDGWVRIQDDVLHVTEDSGPAPNPSADADDDTGESSQATTTSPGLSVDAGANADNPAGSEPSLVEIAPANVVVLEVDYDTSPADQESPHLVSFGEGDAWVLTRGVVITGSWSRSPEAPGYRLVDDSGEPVLLTPGRTWVLLANNSRPFPRADVEVLSAFSARQMLNSARAAEADRNPLG